MSIYLDSAILGEARPAIALGWVDGITTNPILLAKAGNNVHATLTELAHLHANQLFYQLTAPTLEGMREEMQLAASLIGPVLVVKVPPTTSGFQFVKQCTEYPCCVTAVYSPLQAWVAAEVNARYVAVYVNRATRLMGDGLKLVSDVAEILKHSETAIIAASIKSSEEACAALFAGAHHLTLPYGLLTNLIRHPLSEQTVAEFQSKGLGISSARRIELGI